jgi:hypothetical protein
VPERTAQPVEARHGWRAVAIELGVVVFGVLIALGAQQAVESWRTRSDIADFRAALRTELADAVAAYQARVAQSACLGARLDQLERWQQRWRDGVGGPLIGSIGRPLAFRTGSSVWRTGAASTATRMALKERLDWAAAYDSIAHYEALGEREVATWQAMFAFDGATRLSPGEVNTLRGLILSARSTDRSIQLNMGKVNNLAAALGARPMPYRRARGTRGDLCAPLRMPR